jgi:hypothetical protein
MRKYNHDNDFQEKRQFFHLKLAQVSENKTITPCYGQNFESVAKHLLSVQNLKATYVYVHVNFFTGTTAIHQPTIDQPTIDRQTIDQLS